MPNKINDVPAKRPEAETPTVVDEHGEKHPSPEEKLQRHRGPRSPQSSQN